MDQSEATRAARQQQLLAGLRGILPATAILSADEALRVYECDGLAAHCTLPLAVALPTTEAEVRDVLVLCHQLQVPVVARGAGTGLSGGALPHAAGLVLSLERMKRILKLDPAQCLAVVEAGVSNLAISDAARPHGLFFAPDPSSQLVSTIGGNVAENAGGVHCVKYGLTVHHVLALRAITIEGEVLEIGLEAPDAPGYDLLALLNGAEGTLAVVTAVTVRLLPSPPTARVAQASFATVAGAGAAVSAIIAAGIVPAGLELMDRATLIAVSRHIDAGYDLDAGAVLLCEVDGVPEEVDAAIRAVERLLRQCGGKHLRLSASEAERNAIWAGRKAAFPAISAMKPDYYCLDGSVPRRHLSEMLLAIADMEEEFGLACVNVFHAGDGNLHPLILFDGDQPGEWARAEAFGQAILEKTVALGGAITGEHGVGIEKLEKMAVQFSPAELALFRRLRAAFDPVGLLNPGKAIPGDTA